ncbi:ABC transporter ATP-binding protein [Dictyobacter arantiisoli]|uniref:ABC transporter ATP-binding protein n=1 Tax=Dictyobacter arantiisoli TaxID=2014874 RepID=UPI001F3D60CD|nr:ABC transporter ATP-binding protein [Dictyobacter arantiisoli]
MRTFKRIAQAFRPYMGQVILIFLAIILNSILGLVNPLIIRLIFDNAIPQRSTNLLFFCGITLVVMPIFIGFISTGQTYLSTYVGQRVIRDFRNRLYLHLQSMSLRFFTSMKTGEIQSRLANDVGGVQSVVTDTLTRIITSVSVVLSTIFAMFYISWLLSLITLSLLPLSIWITYKVGYTGRNIQKNTQKQLATLTAFMQETLSVSGILLMKIFGRQQLTQERFEDENQKLTDLTVRLQMMMSWFSMLVNIIIALTPALVYLVAGNQIIHDPRHSGISVGDIVAFTALQALLLPAIGQLLNVHVQIYGALALFDRIFEYLDMPIEIIDAPGALKIVPEQIRGSITFRNVYFDYKRNDPYTQMAIFDSVKDKSGIGKDVAGEDVAGEYAQRENNPEYSTLKAISLEIKAGQLVALVGPSGAGKTSLTYLLLRLYDIDRGLLEIDGYDIRSISLESLNNLIGVVTQETYLLHASVKENLLYARPDATEEEMVAAAKAAAIHERITELDNGYDTIVGERGYRLSGGEKQRIAIARVLLKDPRILILDEATSSLDTYSERLIQQSLVPLMNNRTVLAIAHRLSTILSADLILVMKNGEIVERGTHKELLARNGVYTQLYNQQFVSVES